MSQLPSILLRALLPLDAPPPAPGWNRAAMRHLLEGLQLRPAAVLLGLRDAAEPTLILTVRNDALSAHAGQVAFPGGGCDPDDAGPLATALRESEEEIGLDRAAVTPLGYLDRFETISGYSITPVVARVAAHAALRPSPDEVAEVFEVPLAFLREPANLRHYTMSYREHQHAMVEFRYGDYRIWGATAAILANLLQRIDQAAQDEARSA